EETVRGLTSPIQRHIGAHWPTLQCFSLSPIGPGYGGMTVDDMTFHECVRMLEWERDRALLFYPPDGEFTVLNYRISDDFRIPFNISPFVEQMAPDRLDLIIKVRTGLWTIKGT